ncbi:MAG: Branched-chain amino acid transport ATP-binding protein LivF [Thermoleophilia bacterium]|nr:Branched-chain amino acid transport ATP-binding protein LivF [Thermoleophilia bacterium]
MTELLLECRNLVGGYVPEVDILRGVSVHVPRGEIVSIIGPNGAGKSTMVKAVFGLVPVREGQVLLDGEEVTGEPAHELVRRGIAYVPQRENVFPSMSVRENLEIGGITSRAGMEARMEELFTMFPRLAERRSQAAGTLSGGERQMVAFARALMSRPRMLLLDEPSAGLAPKIVAEVLETIRRIRDEEGVSVLLVEQNARAALAMSDRGYVLDQGTDAHTGTGPQLLADPKVAQIYLGVRP